MRGATRISNLAYRIARWTGRTVEAYRYDDIHQRQADEIFETICTQTPERRPSPRLQRRIEAYAREVLGSRRFAPWLRMYTAWAGEFREGWIPDNYFGRVVLPVIQGPARLLAGCKTLTRRLLQAEDLVPDLAYRVNGQWTDVQGRPLDPTAVEDLVFQHGPRVAVKADGTSQGRGVRVVARGGGGLHSPGGGGDLVVQRLIRQPEVFARYNPESLSTLRINTLKQAGRPAEWRGANLRFGRPGTEVVTGASYVKIPITDDQGTLAEEGLLDDWTRVRRHPESGLGWTDLSIPSFHAARDACLRLHDAFPHYTFLGWDVGIAHDGRFYILEWNGIHPGITSIEATTGPAFKDLGWEDLWKQQA